jgi:peptidyl-prolyl cis-trans isomerase C
MAQSLRALRLLPLSLAFLLAGLTGCGNGTEAEQAQASPGPAAAGATAPGATAPGIAPGSGLPPGAPGAEPPGPPYDISKLPPVVAKVNGEEIKSADLINEAKGIQAQIAARGGSQPPGGERFYREVLDSVVARKLLLADARAAGVTVPEAELKAQVDGLRQRFPDAETFKKALDSQGMTEAKMSADLHDQLLLRHYIEDKIVPQVQITDEAAKTFYDQNQQAMKQPEARHLRHILIAAPQNAPAADRQKAKAKAEDLRSQVEKGGDFAQLASANSDDPGSKARGGDLGWLSKGQTVPQFEQAAWALQLNQTSPVVETQFGYHVIQLAEAPKPETTVPFEQAKDRIQSLLRQRGTQDAVRAKVEALKAKAQVQTFL